MTAIKMKETPEGYVKAAFRDLDGGICVLGKSEFVQQDAIELGCRVIPMHLTQEHVRALLPHLECFVRTGKLYLPERYDDDNRPPLELTAEEVIDRLIHHLQATFSGCTVCFVSDVSRCPWPGCMERGGGTCPCHRAHWFVQELNRIRDRAHPSQRAAKLAGGIRYALDHGTDDTARELGTLKHILRAALSGQDYRGQEKPCGSCDDTGQHVVSGGGGDPEAAEPCPSCGEPPPEVKDWHEVLGGYGLEEAKYAMQLYQAGAKWTVTIELDEEKSWAAETAPTPAEALRALADRIELQMLKKEKI